MAVFNGYTSQVNLPAIHAVTGTKPRTIEVWAYINSTQSTTYTTSVWRTFFGYGVNGNNQSFSYFFKTDTKQLAIDAYSNGIYFGNYTPDTWHHIVFTFPGGTDLTTFKCYLDGTEQTQTSMSGSPSLLASPLNFSIGYRAATDNNYFTGKLANLRIYNYELSASDIVDHYQKESIS